MPDGFLSLDPTWIWVMLVVFVTILIRSTFGFGDALFGMPILSMLVGIHTATPLVGMLSATVAITIIARDWRRVEFRSVGWLAISAWCGIPFGLWFLTSIDEWMVNAVLAIVVFTFVLSRRILPAWTINGAGWGIGFGWVAGVLGGAYNTQGPPIVLYGMLKSWPADQFRATLQGYFLLTGPMILGCHAAAGLWNQYVVTLFLVSLPVLLLAVIIGRILNQTFTVERFRSMVDLLLIVVGLTLLFRTIP